MDPEQTRALREAGRLAAEWLDTRAAGRDTTGVDLLLKEAIREFRKAERRARKAERKLKP